MNWEEKIKKGMLLIKEGCKEQNEWGKCYQCPFDEYCTALEEADYFYTPDSWDIKN